MLAYTYVSKGNFELREKPKPVLLNERDAIVRVTLASICSSDLHIKHGSVPRALPGITVGHEMVGIVEEIGSAVTNVKVGDRVTVNVETFCGEAISAHRRDVEKGEGSDTEADVPNSAGTIHASGRHRATDRRGL